MLKYRPWKGFCVWLIPAPIILYFTGSDDLAAGISAISFILTYTWSQQ